MARGTVRQRSKIRKDSWTVQIYLGVDPTTGKKRYRSESVKGTNAQAQRRLTEPLRQVDIGTYTELTHLAVAEYLGKWMRDYAETHVSQRSLEGYRANIERYILPSSLSEKQCSKLYSSSTKSIIPNSVLLELISHQRD